MHAVVVLFMSQWADGNLKKPKPPDRLLANSNSSIFDKHVLLLLKYAQYVDEDV